jgi:hypothetical protein
MRARHLALIRKIDRRACDTFGYEAVFRYFDSEAEAVAYFDSLDRFALWVRSVDPVQLQAIANRWECGGRGQS